MAFCGASGESERLPIWTPKIEVPEVESLPKFLVVREMNIIK